jgi:hypothetical protein
MCKPILWLTLVLSWATASLAFGQADNQLHLPLEPSASSIPARTQEEADRERTKKAYELLQVEIKRDTEKLAQLTGELKDSVDKSGQGILPADTLKKAEQIEKLARTVKSKIKQSYGAGGL